MRSAPSGGGGAGLRPAGATAGQGRGVRVVHTPLNVAGIPWTNVQALRRKGVDAKLVVVERQKMHPEADVSLDRPTGLLRRQAVQWPAFLRLLPKTDVFHFYFGWTLVPRTSAERRLTSSATRVALTPASSVRTTPSAGCPTPR